MPRENECGLCHILVADMLALPFKFQFRMQALAGELPGVKKASW